MSLQRTLLFLAPAVFIVTAFMVLPTLIVLGYSFMSADPYGGVQMPFGVEGYTQLLFSRDFDERLMFTPDYLWIVWRSMLMAAATAGICLLLGFPLAWYLVRQPFKRRQVLLLCITLPFWINVLIRTYCWVLILRDEGLLNRVLWLGRRSGPLHFLYNDGVILLGLVYIFLPFMVLPIFATLERVDFRLVEAAHDLYASRWQVLRRILWPLAKPGVTAGMLLVAAPTLGAFLVPDILGGGKKLLLGSLIQMQFSSSRNWPFGAALSVLISASVLGAWYVIAGRANVRALAR